MSSVLTAQDWETIRAMVAALPPIPDETLDRIAATLATVPLPEKPETHTAA